MKGFFQHYFRLYRPLITSLNALLSPFELSYSLWQVVYYLKKNGASTLVDISTYFDVEKPSITRRVRRLEELQMVEQIPGADRREKIIQLTKTGEAVYRECRNKITALENSLMEGISGEEQSVIFQSLPKVRETILNKEGLYHE